MPSSQARVDGLLDIAGLRVHPPCDIEGDLDRRVLALGGIEQVAQVVLYVQSMQVICLEQLLGATG